MEIWERGIWIVLTSFHGHHRAHGNLGRRPLDPSHSMGAVAPMEEKVEIRRALVAQGVLDPENQAV